MNSEPRRAAVEEQLKDYEILRVRSSAMTPSGLLAALTEADYLIAIMPRSGAFGRSSVMFDIGIAIALGKCVLIVGDARDVPKRIATLPTISVEALNLLPVAMERARPIQPEWRVEKVILPYVHSTAASPGPPETQSEIVLFASIRAAFEGAGATVYGFENEKKSGEGADLTVWHDSLNGDFKQPLAVEIKGQPHNPGSMTFREILDRTGSSALLVVSDVEQPRLWSSDRRTVLIAGAAQLLSALSSLSPGAALDRLVAEATK